MNTSLKKLEYNEILKKLAENSITSFGKELCLSLLPSSNKENVISMLNETEEAINITIRKGNLPIFQISDITLILKKLNSNLNLSASELLDLATILKLSKELKDFFYKDEFFDTSSFPILDSYFACLYSNLGIEQKIFSSILDKDTIADNASSKLSSIRKNKRKLESEIRENLNTMIHSSTYSKCIMDPIVTIRNDRFVIPIKEEFRGNIKGFVHDISSSGSTLFIEPISVFELNNKINNLKFEENIEIERILEELSNLFIPFINELENNINLIAKLDFAFAKSKFAKNINATLPKINEIKQVNLIKARHPLISSDKVVPIDISIGNSYTSLIITGPNTGGKTVALKTTGLLVSMGCSGLAIPAEENSSIYVFDNIFADIGDEQSIEASLSTFSAHITNIISILNNATNNSLILLDELGSGTDPIEGSLLALSILKYFHNLNSLTLATTHYQEIKNYALVTDGFENASCEFDVENLCPTYKILVGVPGKSNAFAISKRLGLSEEILENAKSSLKNDTVSIEELLKSIYDNKLKIEQEKDEIAKNLSQVQMLRKNLEKDLQNKEKNEQEILQKAKEEALNIIMNSKEEVKDNLNEINKIYSKWKSLEELDFSSLSNEEIGKFVRNNYDSHSIKKANNINTALNNKLKDLSKNETNTISTISRESLKEGMKIHITSTSEIATILSLSSKNIRVKIGNATMNIKYENVVSIATDNSNTPNAPLKSNYQKSSSLLKSKEAKTEINVLGQNVEDACFILDKFLDDCYLAKLQTVRIVHGKGTGKLREGIHSFLKKHPHVDSFRLGTFGEGEMGVTIVSLK